MTLYLPFQPSQTHAPKFSLDVDGLQYTLTVTWNVSAQRFYFNLYDNFGAWVVTAPLIATAPGNRIVDFFYNRKMRSIRITTEKPFWRPLGQIVDYSLQGVEPASLNGKHKCEVISPTEFLFYTGSDPLQTVNPGHIVQHGAVHRYANLIEGYAKTTMLIFRNQQFEVF